MLKEKDFDTYGLESLLTDSKYKIDTTDPEREQIISATLESLHSLRQFVVARKFEDKWMMHGMSDNLKESFIPQFKEVGLNANLIDNVTNPTTLTEKIKLKAINSVSSFRDVLNNSEYMHYLSKALKHVSKDVIDIFLDESTTYEHVDRVAFSKTKIHGFSYDNFASKLKGIQILLGAYNTYPRESYESQPIRLSMRWHLLQAGFSFDKNLIVAPKDENVYENDTLENLGWAPEKVHSLNNTFVSVLTMERDFDVLPGILPKTESVPESKLTATLIENCYNTRNIFAYIKNTLYVMCNQYLSMVRSYQ